ncbi:replicative DNA helicase [Sporobacter termitidis DSM 10068]|uniref:Replicative DNA helicase n=1 Tax=Sporobacter termitidis DSM 10068 TaxID=1123282 RepID=A0A1M5Y681_9FIRM|nr:replicative DNA helicase [Sporobacter termitidis]SHI07570.1 replicative DNA helicase [Sporobacter termitidis DSM 10068]
MDELLGRQMPHSIEAEQAVLGSMIIDARCVGDVLGMLKAADFYVQANRDIFETIYSMFTYSMATDPVTVLEQMRVNGVWTENSATYILELVNITPTSANVMEYAAIVRDMSLLRSIADAGGDIMNMALEGTGGAMTILEAAEKKIYALRQGRNSTGLEPISKVLLTVYDQMTEAARSGSKFPGLPSGLDDLDRQIMGLNNSDLILIASRPGMGKTSIALNMALHVAKTSGKTVAVFSLEMSREQLALRLLSSESFIDNKKMQTGRLSAEEWKKIGTAASMISGYDFLINDNPSLSVADMNAQCRRLPNLGLVVIDYLQLMQSASGPAKNGGENRTQVVSDISRMMKIMAKELNVPLICLSQLSRANEGRTDKRPLLSDLRESGAIEQDADIVLGLYREDYYNKEVEFPNIAECIILKNRRGETGKIELKWLPEFTTYTSLERHHNE